MRKGVCRILWTLPVLTMLLINNSILSAQLLEETTAFTERDRNSVDAQQENDDSQKVWPWKTYYTVTLKSINCSSVYGAMNYVFIRVNNASVWSDDMSTGTETLSITLPSVPSSESIYLYVGPYSDYSSSKRLSAQTSAKLKTYVDKGEQSVRFTKGSKITVFADYTVTFEVKSTKSSSSDFSARAQAASIPKLYSPSSAYSINNLSLEFEKPWPYTSTSCTKLDWKHTGIDIRASADSDVYAAEAGTVKVSTSTSGSWKDYITIEHKDSQGNKYTTVYWHLKDRKVFTSGNTKTVTRGQKIAAVAYMYDAIRKKEITHLHFGIRNAPYTYPVSSRGGLPTERCYDPQMTAKDIWQADFVNPINYLP